jgi:hypothetical protein
MNVVCIEKIGENTLELSVKFGSCTIGQIQIRSGLTIIDAVKKDLAADPSLPFCKCGLEALAAAVRRLSRVVWCLGKIPEECLDISIQVESPKSCKVQRIASSEPRIAKVVSMI